MGLFGTLAKPDTDRGSRPLAERMEEIRRIKTKGPEKPKP